jgi:predicted glutamine amidotransferase
MPVAEENCHPFQHDGYLFMHNGHLGSFRSVRRALLSGLSNESFDAIRGSTDSEHVFALFLDEMAGWNAEDEDALAICLNRAVWRALRLVEEVGGGHPSFLNLAVTDGHRGAACRFSNDAEGEPETLYLIQRALYEPVAKGSPERRQHERSESFVVSSERLTDDSAWAPVRPNHLVSFSRKGQVTTFRMDESGLSPA